jgi:hypothetical protein
MNASIPTKLNARCLFTLVMWLGTCAVGCQQGTSVEPFDFTGTGADADTESEVADTSDTTRPDTSGPQCRRDSDTTVADTSHSDAGCHQSWVYFEGERNCCRDVVYRCGNFEFENLSAGILPTAHFVPKRSVFRIAYYRGLVNVVDATLFVRVENRHDKLPDSPMKVFGEQVVVQGEPAFQFDLSGTKMGSNSEILLTGLQYTDACGVTTKLNIRQTITPDGELTGPYGWECEKRWSCNVTPD